MLLLALSAPAKKNELNPVKQDGMKKAGKK